jgi:iron complex transport system permease protein
MILHMSALLGGIVLVIADAIARTVLAPAQLPVGVITVLLGVPAFLWLLAKMSTWGEARS